MTVKFLMSCKLDYSVHAPTEFIFNVQAAAVAQQYVLNEKLNILGAQSVNEYTQGESGNRFIRASANAGNLTLMYSSTVLVEHTETPAGEIQELNVAELPIEVLPFVLPSRYCESDRFSQLAQAEFSHLPRGYSRVEAVCNWVHNHLRFAPGTTNSSTSATQAMDQRSGVCRDFAHVTISMLRALNIPARFVTGYDYGVDASYGPTDFHAYVEAFLGDRWWICDATRLCPRNGLVRIGTGRDAADAAFATIFGNITFNGMKLDIQPLNMEIQEPVGMALSTAALMPVSQPMVSAALH